MNIKHHWSTPIAEFEVNLPENIRKDLINVLLRKEEDREKIAETSPEFHKFMTSKGFYASTHYNLFKEAENHPEKDSILAFEKLACDAYRTYLAEAHDIEDAASLKISGRCFGNIQTDGGRTFPHYHQSVDHVMIHYLDIPSHENPEDERTYRHGFHALLVQDPRGAINYPYWEKVYSIPPYTGKTIIHPAYLWHETNPYRGQGTRVCIVVNFQIMSNNYAELHQEFRY